MQDSENKLESSDQNYAADRDSCTDSKEVYVSRRTWATAVRTIFTAMVSDGTPIVREMGPKMMLCSIHDIQEEAYATLKSKMVGPDVVLM